MGGRGTELETQHSVMRIARANSAASLALLLRWELGKHDLDLDEGRWSGSKLNWWVIGQNHFTFSDWPKCVTNAVIEAMKVDKSGSIFSHCVWRWRWLSDGRYACLKTRFFRAILMSHRSTSKAGSRHDLTTRMNGLMWWDTWSTIILYEVGLVVNAVLGRGSAHMDLVSKSVVGYTILWLWYCFLLIFVLADQINFTRYFRSMSMVSCNSIKHKLHMNLSRCSQSVLANE